MRVSYVFILVALVLSGCKTTSTTVPHKVSVYGNYEHQMVKSWEEAGKKFEAGSYQEALQGYQSFLDQYPYSRWTQMAKYFIGECYEQTQQQDRARMMYREVMDQYPGSVWADLARDKLEQLE